VRAGPRFTLVGLWYLLTRKPGQTLPKVIAAMGLLRTLTCGGWTYVTSTDDHDWHDIFMISYIVFTLPWTLGCIALSPPNPKAIKYRKYLGSLFFGTLVPLIYFFIQHKVHRIPGGTATWIDAPRNHLLTRTQPIPSTPSSNGLSLFSTSLSMPSRPSISRHLSWLSRMSRARARGTCNGFRNSRVHMYNMTQYIELWKLIQGSC